MKTIENIKLKKNQNKAIGELKKRIIIKFDIKSIILFGSVARGESDEESDADLLIVTTKKLSRLERHKITDIVFEINLSYDTNFSTLVIDEDTWTSGFFSILSIYEEITMDGILL